MPILDASWCWDKPRSFRSSISHRRMLPPPYGTNHLLLLHGDFVRSNNHSEKEHPSADQNHHVYQPPPVCLTHLASTSDFKYMPLYASCQPIFDVFCRNIFLTPIAAYNKAITGG